MSLTQCLSLIAGATLAGTAVADSAITADEARAIVAEMLADAETRSSLQSSGGTAGHDGKFFLSSPGGNFRLNVGGQLQFRYMLNFGDELGQVEVDPGPPVVFASNDVESGFQTRRTKLNFGGTIHNNIDFYVLGAFSRSSGNFQLEDAWTRFKLDDNSSLRIGQFKAPFLMEELVSPTRQMAADRSVTNSVFNQGRSQGIEYRYNQDDWRLAVAFTDGFRTQNTEYTDNNNTGGLVADDVTGDLAGASWGGGESDIALTARFEYKGAGSWGQFADFTSAAGSETAWMIGAAGHYESGKADGFGTSDYKSYGYTIDALVKGDSWSLFGAFIGRTFDVDNGLLNAAGNTIDKTSDYGAVIQAAFRIPESKWELFGRWDAVYADGDYDNSSDFNTLTFGANYYMHGHAAKFTVDLQWFLDDVAGNDLISANSGLGLLDDGINKDQVAIRAQFQLLF